MALNQRGKQPLELQKNTAQQNSEASAVEHKEAKSHKTLVKSYRYFREVADATFILFRDIGHAVKQGACALGRWFRPKLHSAIRKVGRFCIRVFRAVSEPAQKIRRGFYLIERNYHFHREEHSVFSSVVYAVKTFTVGLLNNTRLVKSFFSYLAPAAMILCLVLVVNYASNLTFAIAVNYNGNDIGYISDESVFENAETILQGRIVYVDGNEPLQVPAKFSISVVDKYKIVDDAALANNMISLSNLEISEAEGLYVDGTFYGAVENAQTVQDALDAKLAKYREENPDAEVSFVQDVQLVSGLFLTSSIISDEQMINLINSEVAGQQTYTVQAGDSPILIANKNGLDYASFKALNPTIEQRCMPGDTVLISTAQPFLSVKVSKTEVYEQEVPFTTSESTDNKYMKGYKKVVQQGVNGLNRITATVDYVDGVEVARTVTNTEVLRDPVEQKIVVGNAAPSVQVPGSSTQTAKGLFLWPVNGGYVSSPYGYRGGEFHKGLDIAAPAGTTIYAAMDGTVTLAKTGSGFGKHVIIQHSNGMTTLYAHCSQLYVTPGQYVTQGQAIAAVGQTGWASGNHLHFQVTLNGKIVNPSNYL